MVTPEDKAQRIFMMYVRALDPTHGILIKTEVKNQALKLAKLHCNTMLDEIDLILEKQGYKKNEGNCYYLDYPLQRHELYEDTLIQLAIMTKSLS